MDNSDTISAQASLDLPEPLRVFVCRIAPRTVRRNIPRGTLLASSADITHIDPLTKYPEFYQDTIGRFTLPNPVVLEFGQNPISDGQSDIRQGDLLVLLVGSDDPNGSTNLRGVIGLAEVDALHATGSGPSRRLALRAHPILQLDDFLTLPAIRESKYRKESLIDDIGIFGLTLSPQAHNCARFYKNEEPDNLREQRLRGLLGMFTEVDSGTKDKLGSVRSDLAALVPAAPTYIEEESPVDAGNDEVEKTTIPPVSFLVSVALCAKPFVILTGPSGTGKSRVAIELARAFDYGASLPLHLEASRVSPATCMAFVAVGANWTDQRDLLGYANPFGPKRVVEAAGANEAYETHETYEVTDTLKLILRALHPEYRTRPHFLVLDEMNLSHVERYFSSFLSLMEADQHSSGSSRFELISREDLRLIADVLALQDGSPMELASARALLTEARGVPFPSNLFVLGTVNVDETTYMFSPKVLDRAFVIELRSVAPSAYFSGVNRPTATIAGAKAAILFQTSITRRSDYQGNPPSPVASLDYAMATARVDPKTAAKLKIAVQTALDGAYKLLSPVGFEFAHRVVNEVILFMVVWIEARHLKAEGSLAFSTAWRSALDCVMLMKVLPKIHGNRREMGESLSALSSFFAGKGAPDAAYTLGNTMHVEISEDERLTLPLRYSCQKVATLDRRLRASGYATYIS